MRKKTRSQTFGLLSDSLRSLVRKSIVLLSDSLRSLVRKSIVLLSDSLRSLDDKASQGYLMRPHSVLPSRIEFTPTRRKFY